MSVADDTTAPGGSRLLAEVLAAEKAERSRVARALHDGGLQLALAALQELDGIASGDPEAPAALRRDLEELVVALRSLTMAADDDSLSRLDLEQGVRRLADLAARRARLRIDVKVDARAAGVHDVLVRDTIREMLTNTLRHAGGTRVEVLVEHAGDHIAISTADDGKGIVEEALAEAQRTGHMGLRGFQRTAEELDGRFDYGIGLDGRGARVTLRLPRNALVAQESLEQQLQQERRWSAALVRAMRDALLVVRNGAVVQVNDAFCELTDLAREDLLGTQVAQAVFWGGLEPFGSWLTAMQEAGGGDDRVALRRPDGEHFDVLASVARIDDGRGGDIGVLVLFKPTATLLF